jgi:hypothetical protein
MIIVCYIGGLKYLIWGNEGQELWSDVAFTRRRGYALASAKLYHRLFKVLACPYSNK